MPDTSSTQLSDVNTLRAPSQEGQAFVESLVKMLEDDRAADAQDANLCELPADLQKYVLKMKLIIKVSAMANETKGVDVKQHPCYLAMCQRLYTSYLEDIKEKNETPGSVWTYSTFCDFAEKLIWDEFDADWAGFGQMVMKYLNSPDLPIIEVTAGVFNDKCTAMKFFGTRTTYVINMMGALNGVMTTDAIQALSTNTTALVDVDLGLARKEWSPTWIKLMHDASTGGASAVEATCKNIMSERAPMEDLAAPAVK